MCQYNFLRKNDGFLLISTYFVIFILIVLAAVFFSQAVNEHSFTKKSLAGMEAKYNAERGIDYALTEIKYNSGFLTHDTAESPVGSGNYILTPASSSPAPRLSNVAIVDGNYASTTGDFIVKAYRDPISASDEIVILSRGRHEDTERLFLAKYVPNSLYRFFIFTPYDFWPGANQYDAGGGSIHTNQSFILSGSATIENITEMSAAQYLKYYVRGYVPEGCAVGDCTEGGGGTTWADIFYNWRDPWYTANNNNTGDPFYDYFNNPDGRLSGNKSGLLMENGSGGYTKWDGELATLLDPRDSANYSIYAAYTTINGVTIPNWLNTTWSWNKYWQLETGYDGYTYPANEIPVNYFDTSEQSQDWINFLASSGLEGTVMDTNTGGSHIEPLSIDGAASYMSAAQQGGIYITCDDSNIYVKINQYNGGEPLTMAEDGSININGYTVFEGKSFVDANSTNTKKVIKINIGALKEALGNDAGLDDKIIYSEYPVALSDALSITEGGLTTVCKENVYVHGNYNTGDNPQDEYETPRPSAVISAKDTYTLTESFYGFSDDFYSWFWDEDHVPLPQHNLNYPYEHDFYCPREGAFNYSESCITSLIASGRDPEETTHEDYNAGRNWLSSWDWDENRTCESTNAFCMANSVDNSIDHIYNLGLVGYRGYEPKVLERWGYYSNWGTDTAPPSNWLAANRIITGAFIRLQSDDFKWAEYPSTSWPYFDNSKARRLCDEFPAFPGYCRKAEYPGWAWDMTTYTPGGSKNNFLYDTEFAEGSVPPGDLVGFSATIFLEISNTETNWTQHYKEVSAL